LCIDKPKGQPSIFECIGMMMTLAFVRVLDMASE